MKNQLIKYNNNGAAYVTYYNNKIYLHDVLKTIDNNGAECGIYSLCNTIGLLIYINDDNEHASVKLIK